MPAIELLWQPACQRLALTLLHFLWQGLGVMILVAAAVRLLKLRHGPPRYAAYLVGMLVMAVCPVVTFLAIEAPQAAQLDSEPSVAVAEKTLGQSDEMVLPGQFDWTSSANIDSATPLPAGPTEISADRVTTAVPEDTLDHTL